MLGKLNDKYHIIFFTKTLFNAALLCTTSVLVSFTSPHETRNERDIIKLKPPGHSKMQYSRWNYSQHNCQSYYMKLSTNE
jgi:hypothetical protein